MNQEKLRSKGASASPSDGIASEFFKVPNRVADVLMAYVTGVQFKVFICVWRVTVGFRRTEFSLSLSQLARRAGISRDSALRALGFWERTGLIRKSKRPDGRSTSVYRILPACEVDGGLRRLAEKSGRSDSSTATGRRQRPSLDGFFDPIKETIERHQNNSLTKDLTEQVTDIGSQPTGKLPGRGMDIPEGAFVPEPDPWTMVKEDLKSTMNPHSYETWIAPTWLEYALNDVLFVRAPNAEWEFVPGQFGAEIMRALKALGLPYEEVILKPMPTIH